MSDLRVHLESIHVHPVKSCAGISLQSALLDETGFDLDRAYMVVDPSGRFVSQRVLPRMALVRTTLKSAELILRAPGMLALHVALDRVEERSEAEVWKDRVAAFDMGALCAQWFSDFLGQPLRLVRFDPDVQRLASREWTGELEAPTAFQDGFPLLVASTAGLDELNRRLALAGESPITMNRFRPNLVLSGLDPNGEDQLDEIAFTTADGPVRLKCVKPCVRCPIPDVDPESGVPGHAVGDTLSTYRGHPRMGGAVTFGMNLVIVEGVGRTLSVGMEGDATYALA
ncbi:MAG: MOSC N-terminal beta barrel domain-containing protein [Caldimonas sp.]